MSIASVMLAANDPEDLRNVVYEQGRMIEELQKRFLDLQTLSEITPDFGDGFAAGMSAESLKIRAESVESNWWMPLTVADDDVTLVFALALGKDEDGNKILYAGGRFNRIGGVAAKNIAKYTFVNRQWSALGDGLNDDVAAIAIGAAGDVYAGGKFTNAGGVANADHIAKWNGSAWSALGGGLNGDVFAVAIGAAGDVYAGGAFTNAGGEAYANFIAKWNGSAWSALGGGLNDDVFAVAIGAAGDIYAGGAFTNAGGDANADHIAKWNGSAWSALGDGLNDDVEAIAIGAAGDVYAGGVFTNAGGDANADYIAKWDGSAWSALGDGLNDDGVFAVAIGAAGDV
ncbi:MAG: hypothetical protein LC130_16995, partial [Bryobacterales bacterium]|nr:hypothetical protein [Bryobacterales bacterium]